ncbi:MAG: Ig-like domain-containing protein, partial [Kaistella sp.]
SNYFVDKIQPEKWTLVSDSIQQEFTAQISEKNPFEIRIKSQFKEGKKYALTVPKETVSSFYETILKSYRFDFESDKIENYGTLVVTLENAPEHILWLQLLSESGNVAYSRYSKERSITFASLKPGKYKLRILVDNNENGIWDAADFAAGEFAEDIYVFEKTIEIRPFWEIREKWNVLPEPGETVSEAEPVTENLQKPAVKKLPAKP